MSLLDDTVSSANGKKLNVSKVVHQENELSTPRTEQITYLKTFTFYIKNYATKNICGQSGFCCLNFLTYMVVFVRNR